MSTPEREITFSEAVREALAEEMRRDARVFIIGEDVAEAGTPFKVLLGLVDEFGPERVIDSPISGAGINIMDMLNRSRGDIAVTLIDVDQRVPKEPVERIPGIAGVLSVRCLGC